MIYIDKYAWFSGLRETNPLLKILFGGMSLLACIASWSAVSYAVVFVTMFCVTVFKGKIPLAYYVKLLVLPLGFLTLGVTGIIVEVSSSAVSENAIASLNVFGYSIFVTHTGLQTAMMLVCKSMAAVSCLYFIILTTPVQDIVYFMQRIRCPQIIIVLSLLIYQFIFLLLDIADIKLKSMFCRGGFRGLKRFSRDVGMLWASVFVQAWLKSQWTFKSMQTRGYDGRLKFVTKNNRLRTREWALLLFFVFLVMIPNFLVPFQ